MMNNFQIMFACVLTLCIMSCIQNFTCGPSDPNKPSRCSNMFGTIGCIICCGSIIYILSRKSVGNNMGK